jgi:hypothetical protein
VFGQRIERDFLTNEMRRSYQTSYQTGTRTYFLPYTGYVGGWPVNVAKDRATFLHR